MFLFLVLRRFDIGWNFGFDNFIPFKNLKAFSMRKSYRSEENSGFILPRVKNLVLKCEAWTKTTTKITGI